MRNASEVSDQALTVLGYAPVQRSVLSIADKTDILEACITDLEWGWLDSISLQKWLHTAAVKPKSVVFNGLAPKEEEVIHLADFRFYPDRPKRPWEALVFFRMRHDNSGKLLLAQGTGHSLAFGAVRYDPLSLSCIDRKEIAQLLETYGDDLFVTFIQELEHRAREATTHFSLCAERLQKTHSFLKGVMSRTQIRRAEAE